MTIVQPHCDLLLLNSKKDDEKRDKANYHCCPYYSAQFHCFSLLQYWIWRSIRSNTCNYLNFRCSPWRYVYFGYSDLSVSIGGRQSGRSCRNNSNKCCSYRFSRSNKSLAWSSCRRWFWWVVVRLCCRAKKRLIRSFSKIIDSLWNILWVVS